MATWIFWVNKSPLNSIPVLFFDIGYVRWVKSRSWFCLYILWQSLIDPCRSVYFPVISLQHALRDTPHPIDILHSFSSSSCKIVRRPKLTAGVRKRSSLGGQSWNHQAEAEVEGEIRWRWSQSMVYDWGQFWSKWPENLHFLRDMILGCQDFLEFFWDKGIPSPKPLHFPPL